MPTVGRISVELTLALFQMPINIVQQFLLANFKSLRRLANIRRSNPTVS